MGATAILALAVLVLGCVFAATAGPRQALATRTQSLRQTLGATPQLAQNIEVTSTWSGVSSILSQGNPFGPGLNLTEPDFSQITGQLHDDFNHGVVRLAPYSEDWAGMTSSAHDVNTALPTGGVPVRFQMDYRDPFTQYTRLVAGRYPEAKAPPATGSAASGGASGFVPTIQVVVSQQTARRFGLHAGSKVTISGEQLATTGKVAPVTLDVTGIIAPREASSTFWAADPTALTPDLIKPLGASPFWVAEVLAGPGEIAAVQTDFGRQGLDFEWELPLDFASLNGDQAQALYNALSKLASQTPTMTGNMASIASALTASNGLLQPLSTFISTAQAVDTLLWLLYVSLAVAGLVTLLLAARMVVMRRSDELTTLRARGASLPQITGTMVRGAAIACVPAAAIAVALAVLLVPGPAPGGWWVPGATLAIAICAPASIAAWRQRLPRHRPRGRRRGRGWARLVAEATACLGAIAGIIVFRQQGMQAGTQVNLYTSAAPVLIAIPAVIVVLRLYPLLLRALLRGSSRRAGATAFLGLARAARTALTPALPAFALVLALTTAAFAGMVRDAVTRGEVAASWQTAGADVTISTAGPLSGGEVITPAAVRAVAAVPGVTHAAAAWENSWSAPNNQPVTGIVVDPASYAALVSGTQTFPPVRAALLAAGSPQPVLASPRAAADIGGHGSGTLTEQNGIAPLNVRVAGLLPSTPAAPGSAAFVIMPLAAIHGQAGPVPLNTLLLTGTNIDSARLTAVLDKMLPEAAATYRSDILDGLSGAPLQHGTSVLFALALVAAAALGLAVMLLELALGAAERETTLARLAAMGLGEGQRARVVTLEVLPAVLAAAVAAGASAYVLPRVVAPAIDLSVFTGTRSVALAPDLASFAVPLAGLVVAAFVVLGVEIRSRRRHGVAGSLRIGE